MYKTIRIKIHPTTKAVGLLLIIFVNLENICNETIQELKTVLESSHPMWDNYYKECVLRKAKC